MAGHDLLERRGGIVIAWSRWRFDMASFALALFCRISICIAGLFHVHLVTTSCQVRVGDFCWLACLPQRAKGAYGGSSGACTHNVFMYVIGKSRYFW